MNVGIFNREPAPAYAAEEQQRGDNLTRFINNVASNPDNATHSSLPHYQAAARDAYGNAAAYGEQPKGR